MNIGEQIKAKRKSQRISAEDLAILLNLKKENIYKWERGSVPSNPVEYKRVMDWLEEKSDHSPNYSEDHLKYVALLESTNKTLEKSIQLSLNALLEGQRDIKALLKTNQQNIDDLLADNGRELAEVRVQTGKRNAVNLGVALQQDNSVSDSKSKSKA